MTDFGPCRTCGKPAECIARYCYPCLRKRHGNFGDADRSDFAMQIQKGRRRKGPKWAFLNQKRGKNKDTGSEGEPCDPTP